MADEGTSGGKKIARLEKGNKERTARHADVMNEIIDAINALYALTISPQSAGKLVWADANGVLQLSGTGCDDGDSCVPDPPEDAGPYVLGAEAGEMEWLATDQCDCNQSGEIDGGGA